MASTIWDAGLKLFQFGSDNPFPRVTKGRISLAFIHCKTEDEAHEYITQKSYYLLPNTETLFKVQLLQRLLVNYSTTLQANCISSCFL